MRAVIATTICVLLLAACGIKGPLYLPSSTDSPAAQPSSTNTSTETPAEASPVETPAEAPSQP